MQIRLNDDPMQRISKFYLSPDEEDPEEETREKAGDDVEVLGKWNYSRPYVPDFETFEPTKIYRKNAQVETMAWSSMIADNACCSPDARGQLTIFILVFTLR